VVVSTPPVEKCSLAGPGRTGLYLGSPGLRITDIRHLTILCVTHYYVCMKNKTDSTTLQQKLALELRRGIVVLAALSQLDSARYGYSLLQQLAERGLGIEQGTLYPLLRRLDEQGLLESEWNVEGPRPRKYYRLSRAGAEVLQSLSEQWYALVEVMNGLLEGTEGD
jgi:PadR family transcriptional regulator PadR